MKLQDFQCSKCSHPAHLPFSVQWSEDDNVALASEKGVYITGLEPMPKSKSPVLHTSRYYIACSKACPTEHCGIDPNELIKDLDQQQMYELVQNVTLSPVFKNSSYIPSVKQIAWSPVIQKHKFRCLLGILSDSGLLNIYYSCRGKWEPDSALSAAWYQHCSSQWKVTPSDSKNTLKELKWRSYKLKLSAFCWGSVLGRQWYLLLCGSLDSTLTVWKVSQDPGVKGINVDLLDELPLLELTETPITALYCHSIEPNKYMVIVCYLNGRIINMVISLSSNKINTLSHHIIWEDSDKIQVYPGGVLIKSTSDGLLSTVVKGCYILIFRINPSGELKSYEVIDTQELLITGLADLSAMEMLATGYSGSMYVLNLEKDKPLFTKTHNSLRGSHFSCNGLALSNSKSIAVIPYSVKTNFDHLSMKELCHLLWCSVADYCDLISIISVHTGPLSSIWDAIDLLRIESIINNSNDNWMSLNKCFGSISLEELDTMENDQLKKNLAILKILQVVDHDPIKYTKAEVAVIEEDMLELIMSCHVFKKISNATMDNLTDFESSSFYLMKKWLEYIINKHSAKYSFTATTATTLLEEFNDKLECNKELCIICGNEMPWFTGASTAKCLSGHEIPRCCLSLVQCGGPLAYYKCFNCSVIAHPDAVSDENNCCIYCDNTFKLTEIL